jgi:hypothetical protein
MLIEHIIKWRKIITEGVRIPHPEDEIIELGVPGIKRTIERLKNVVRHSSALSTKYDGKPAVMFGRNEQGQLVFTDKPRFVAKSYNGRATSPEELKNVIVGRAKEGTDMVERNAYADMMAGLWSAFEAAIPKNFRGYIWGDLMWNQRPALIKGRWVFEPNTVRYSVDANSEFGRQIEQSRAGVAVHHYYPLGSEDAEPLTKLPNYNNKSGLLIFLANIPTPPKLSMDARRLARLEEMYKNSANQQAITALLNPTVLRQLEISDFSDLIIQFVNWRAAHPEGFRGDMAQEFLEWITTNTDRLKISDSKREHIVDHLEMHQGAFDLLLEFFFESMYLKDSLIAQADTDAGGVMATKGENPGGEGYVYTKDNDQFKLVNRAEFSGENFRRNRK